MSSWPDRWAIDEGGYEYMRGIDEVYGLDEG